MRIKPISLFIPNQSAIEDITIFVNEAKTNFATLRNEGKVRSLDTGYLIYRISDTDQAFTGIVGGVSIEDFLDDFIVHHERTIPAKELQHASIAQEQGGISKPILLTHRPIPILRNIIDQHVSSSPILDIYLSDYKAFHQLWPVVDKEHIAQINHAYAQLDHMYIVDGHHRTEAIKILSQQIDSIQHGMCAFFDIENLKILPFNRLVKLKQEISIDYLVKRLKKYGVVKFDPINEFPQEEHIVHLLLENQLLSLKWNTDIIRKSNAVDNLDVNLVKECILNDILEISDVRTSQNISYIEGNKSLDEIKELVNKSNNQMAILLHPIDIADMIHITDNGELLPPKSTWFLPRMVNGIVLYTFED